jgi:membrane protein
MDASKLWSETKGFATDFGRDRPFRLAASLSYYSLLSLAPLVLVVIALAGFVFGRDAVEGRIVGEIEGLVGRAGAEVVQTVISNAHGPEAGMVSLVLGIATLLLGASTVFVQLQSALNQIWEVKADPQHKSAVWQLVRDRLLSLAMILGVGFLLLVSLMISAALSAASTWMQGRVALHPVFWQAIDVVISFGIITLLIAMIFKFLPDAMIRWSDVWFGALVTAALFTTGKYLIGVYLGHTSVGSAYGAAGSVVVFMVWVYYAALILFFGAKITQARTKRQRGKPPPVEYAKRAPRKARK